MSKNDSTLEFRWHSAMAEIAKSDWNRLAAPLETPFLEWEWLHQLEASGSIVPKTGWHPRHLTIRAGGQLIAAAPLYVKDHSEGEFVFDHAWAQVAEKLGLRYYPKMVGMSPVTPVAGYRFLIDPRVDEAALTRSMTGIIARYGMENELSGCSFLHVDPHWGESLKKWGFHAWLHQRYMWENPGYRSFDDYLNVFNTNQRKNIRRERRKISDQNLYLKPVFGDRISADLIPLVYRFYEDTNDKFGPWSCKYLNEEFFEGIRRAWSNRLLIVAAYAVKENTRPIGASFLVVKNNRMYGRYWGSRRWYDALHFNACYYAPIQWGIENGIRFFDPGVGSEHKMRRGFTSLSGYSLHRFFDPRLNALFAKYIGRFNQAEKQYIDALNEAMPVKTA